jgi:hypothetical protein
MAINFQHSKKLCFSTTPTVRKPGCTILTPHLSCIIEETLKVHSNKKYMQNISADQLKVNVWLHIFNLNGSHSHLSSHAISVSISQRSRNVFEHGLLKVEQMLTH